MRNRLGWLMGLWLLTACGMGGDSTGADGVDLAALKPLSGKEKALITAAQNAAQQGSFDTAERDYLQAVALSEGQVDAHVALVDFYTARHQPEKAAAILAQAHALQPTHPVVAYRIGKQALAKGEYAQASKHFQQGLKRAIVPVDLHNAAGVAADMLGNHTVAQTHYQAAISAARGGDTGFIKNNLAMSYLFANQPSRALPLLKAEVKKGKPSPVIRHNLALAYGLLGKHAEAREALKPLNTEEAVRSANLARLKAYHARPSGIPPQTAITDSAPRPED